MALCKVELSPGEECGQPAEYYLRVRDRVTSMTTTVRVCEEHKKDHDRKAARTRIKNK